MGTVNTDLRTEDRLRAIGVLATAPHLAQLFERYDAPFINADVTFNPAVGHIEAIAHQVAREAGCTPDDALLMLIYAIVQRWADEPERPLIDDVLRRVRAVELYRLWPHGSGDAGSWDTAYEYIPINTPEDKIAAVAIATHLAYLERMQQTVADVGVYHIPPLDDVIEHTDLVEPSIFGALTNPTFFATLLASADATLDDCAVILAGSDRADSAMAVARLVEHIRDIVMRVTDEWTRRPLEQKLQLLGWLLAGLELKDLLGAVDNPAALTGEALHDETVAIVRAAVNATEAR